MLYLLDFFGCHPGVPLSVRTNSELPVMRRLYPWLRFDVKGFAVPSIDLRRNSGTRLENSEKFVTQPLFKRKGSCPEFSGIVSLEFRIPP